MGQRLNLEIISKGKPVANAYYHWSGFTSSALGKASAAVLTLKTLEDKNVLAKAVKALEFTGATLTEEEYEAISKMDTGGRIFVKPEVVNRNAGLIGVTEKSIKDTQEWGEQHIRIDIDKKIVDVYEAFWTDSLEQYKEDYPRAAALVEMEFDPYELSFDQLDEFIAFCESSEVHDWLFEGDRVISFVE